MYENFLSNLKIIELEEALDFLGGEKDLLKELLKSFVNDKKFDITQLESFEKKDKTQAASYVHYFKGAARQLCMKRLAGVGQILEDVLREKTSGNISELNNLFSEEYKNAINQAEKLLKEI